MPTTRNDIHSPTRFDPTRYDYIGFICSRLPSGAVQDPSDPHAKRFIREHKHGGPHGLGQCDHCGAYYTYGAIFSYEDESGETRWISSGADCAEGRFTLPDRFAFENKTIRREVAKLRSWGKLSARVAEVFESNPGLAEAVEWAAEMDQTMGALINPTGDDGDTWAAYWDGETDEDARREYHALRRHIGFHVDTIQDIKGKLRRFGSISEKQIAFVLKLHEEGQEKLANLRKIVEEIAAMEPLEGGRRTVEGTIKSAKSVDTPYGYQTKIVLVLESGHAIYGTAPAALLDAAYEREVELAGQRVRLTATIDPSVGDNDFAVFKRPSKPEILSA